MHSDTFEGNFERHNFDYANDERIKTSSSLNDIWQESKGLNAGQASIKYVMRRQEPKIQSTIHIRHQFRSEKLWDPSNKLLGNE